MTPRCTRRLAIEVAAPAACGAGGDERSGDERKGGDAAAGTAAGWTSWIELAPPARRQVMRVSRGPTRTHDVPASVGASGSGASAQ